METCIFAPVVSEEEWQTVPVEIGKKISKFVNEKFEEFITSNALLETKSTNSEKSYAEVMEQNESLSSENESFKARLEAANISIAELNTQVSNISAELIKLQTQAHQLESEAAEYCHQRNRERSLLNSQIESLTEELHNRTDEFLNMRRDNTSRCIQLETKLSEKTQELSMSNKQIKSLQELNQNLITCNEKLVQKIFNICETHARINESNVRQIEAKTKLANVCESMYELSEERARVAQKLLYQARERYGELETKHKQAELSNEVTISKKNDCIALLKKELETANEIIDQCKCDAGRDIEVPGKEDTSCTELCSRYVNSMKEQLATKEEEYNWLNKVTTCIVKESEERGVLIKKLRKECRDTSDAHVSIKLENDALRVELQQLREANMENRRLNL